MAAKNELGRRGEDLAAAELERTGLVVLTRNWRCASGEIDIIATDGLSTVVFCEVKTRSGVGYGTPFEAVTMPKRRRIRRLAHLWLSEFTCPSSVPRFDVIGVVFDGDVATLEHRAGAF